MIEDIFVSRKEVLYYEWLNSTNINIILEKQGIVGGRMFARVARLLIKSGLAQVTSKKIKSSYKEGAVHISHDDENLVDLVIAACDWVLENSLSHPDPTKDVAVFYETHKDALTAFTKELKDKLSAKEYRYFYQSVDGMN